MVTKSTKYPLQAAKHRAADIVMTPSLSPNYYPFSVPLNMKFTYYATMCTKTFQ
jgi:hypothetical protein